MPQDLAQAAALRLEAAAAGEPYAQYNLALMFANGEGVGSSLTSAARWMARAVETATNHPESHELLADALDVQARIFKNLQVQYCRAWGTRFSRLKQLKN